MLKNFKFIILLFMMAFCSLTACHQVYATQVDFKSSEPKYVMSPQSQIQKNSLIKIFSANSPGCNQEIVKFSNHEQQIQYETALFKYEMWRLDFIKKIHEEQKEETVLHSKIIFWSLIVTGIILLGSLIFSSCSLNKNANAFIINGYGFTLHLMINSVLLLLVAWLSFLYYMYVTQMYPII